MGSYSNLTPVSITSLFRAREHTSPWAQIAAQVTPEATAAATPGPLQPVADITSPWSDPSTLSRIVYSDIYGTNDGPLTREAALAIPAVARARHLITSTIAQLPLRAFVGEAEVTDQPTWLYRTDHGLPPQHRTLWMVDDLLFYGWSLAVVRRGFDGQILDMGRVPMGRWKFNPQGVVLVDDKPVSSDEVVLVPGFTEGLLRFGAAPLRQALRLEAAASKAAENPAAHINLHYTGEKPQTPEEIQTLIDGWAAARSGKNGGVAYSTKYVDVQELGAAAEHLLVEGRNAEAVNVARLCSIPAAMLDATTSGASLTYETTAGRNGQFIDYGLSLYMTPITARLSMDDVVARGGSIRFDTEALRQRTPVPTGPITED